MAFAEKHGTKFRLVFRLNGKRFTHTLMTEEKGMKKIVKSTIIFRRQHWLAIYLLRSFFFQWCGSSANG